MEFAQGSRSPRPSGKPEMFRHNYPRKTPFRLPICATDARASLFAASAGSQDPHASRSTCPDSVHNILRIEAPTQTTSGSSLLRARSFATWETITVACSTPASSVQIRPSHRKLTEPTSRKNRCVKASEDGTFAEENCSSLTQFRLNAKHLELFFGDGSSVEFHPSLEIDTEE